MVDREEIVMSAASTILTCAVTGNLTKPEMNASLPIGRMAFPMLIQSRLLGGHVRIGMEDTVYLDKGKLTNGNAELVDKARWLIEKLGGALASSDEARDRLGLRR